MKKSIIFLAAIAVVYPQIVIADTVQRSVESDARTIILGGANILNTDCDAQPREFQLRSKPKLGKVSHNVTERPFRRIGADKFQHCLGQVTQMTNIFYTAGSAKGNEILRFREVPISGKTIWWTVEITIE